MEHNRGPINKSIELFPSNIWQRCQKEWKRINWADAEGKTGHLPVEQLDLHLLPEKINSKWIKNFISKQEKQELVQETFIVPEGPMQASRGESSSMVLFHDGGNMLK